MRYLFVLMLCLVMMVSVSGCSTGSDPEPKLVATGGKSNDADSPMTNPKVGEPGSKKAGKTTIVVSTVSDGGWIAEAKRKYEALHPHVEIQIQSHRPADSDIKISNDIHNLLMVINTELLSGKGPDVINISYASPENWIHKGMLANLSELMTADPNYDPSELLEPILEASKSNGSLYVMPLSFQLRSLLVGDEDALQAAGVHIDDANWTWDDFIKIAEKLIGDQKNKYAIGGPPPELLLTMQIRTDYKRWVDMAQRQAHFQTDAFIALLEQTKELYDRQFAAPPEKLASSKTEMYFKPSGVSSWGSYLMARKAYPNGKLYRMPSSSENQSGIHFETPEALAINANSSVQQEAWDFIKFVMSEEMQYTPEIPLQYSNIPVNKSAYHQWMNDIRNESKKGSIELMDGTTTKVTEQDIADFESLIARAATLTAEDDQILTMIHEEAVAYFSGQKSAEAVASLLQNRIMTYINE